MRIHLSRWLISLTVLSIAACTPLQDDNVGSGFVIVDEDFWGADHETPYPFTVDGEISCGHHVAFGRGVYFDPVGFTDGRYISTPLNKAAAESLKQADMIPNAPYSIKKDADLREVIALGLKLCDEIRNSIEDKG